MGTGIPDSGPTTIIRNHDDEGGPVTSALGCRDSGVDRDRWVLTLIAGKLANWRWLATSVERGGLRLIYAAGIPSDDQQGKF